MVTKIDTSKLGEHIIELKVLKSKVCDYKPTKIPVSENSGRSVDKMLKIEKSLQVVQEGMGLILNNTISYMEQRKISIESKEQTATDEVSR